MNAKPETLGMDYAAAIQERAELLDILRILVEHAQERYPHFESPRGQAEIDLALKLLARSDDDEARFFDDDDYFFDAGKMVDRP